MIVNTRIEKDVNLQWDPRTGKYATAYVLNVVVDQSHKDTFPKMSIVEENEAGAYYYGETDMGIVSFGYLAKDPGFRPGHGGMWSSNGMTMGPIVGKELLDVIVVTSEGYRFASHMTKDAADKLLPEGYVYLRGDYGYDLFKA